MSQLLHFTVPEILHGIVAVVVLGAVLLLTVSAAAFLRALLSRNTLPQPRRHSSPFEAPRNTASSTRLPRFAQQTGGSGDILLTNTRHQQQRRAKE